MNGAICILRRPDDLTQVVDAGSIIGHLILRIPERPKIPGRPIFFPKHGVQPSYIRRRQALGRARTRRADGLAQIVDAHAERHRVPFERRQLMDLTIRLPLHSFKTKDLERRRLHAGGVANAILRPPHYLAQIVDTKSIGIAAAGQGAERRQFAVTPDGAATLQVGTESTKIFIIRICLGNLGTDRGLAIKVRSVRPAVGSAECAEVDQRPGAIPKEGVLRAVGNQVRRPSTQPILFMSIAVAFVPFPNTPRSVTEYCGFRFLAPGGGSRHRRQGSYQAQG